MQHKSPFDMKKVADLRKSERAVVDYLLEMGPTSHLMSARELAIGAKTSDASVFRAVKALGYDNLQELRETLALANSNGTEPPPRARFDQTVDEIEPDQILSASIARCSQGLDSLSRTIPPELFEEAVDLLSSSARIVWRGVGPTGCLADYAELHCRRDGIPSISMTKAGISLADDLLLLAPTDALVVFTYGRVQIHTSAVLDHADEIGCSVILVTDGLERKLRNHVDLLLDCRRGDRLRFSSHALTIVLIESLILGVAQRNKERADSSLEMVGHLRKELSGRQT
jgi:DNA-binding MurR/RpiR family transcriptional regulator